MWINLTILVFSLNLHFLIVKSDGNFYKLKMKNKTKGKPHYSFKVLYIGFLLFLPVYPVRSSISQLQHTEVQTSSKAKMQHCELQSLLLSLPNWNLSCFVGITASQIRWSTRNHIFLRKCIADYTCPTCYCFTREKQNQTKQKTTKLVSLALPENHAEKLGTANHVFPSFIMMGLFKRQCPRGSPASCQNVI